MSSVDTKYLEKQNGKWSYIINPPPPMNLILASLDSAASKFDGIQKVAYNKLHCGDWNPDLDQQPVTTRAAKRNCIYSKSFPGSQGVCMPSFMPIGPKLWSGERFLYIGYKLIPLLD